MAELSHDEVVGILGQLSDLIIVGEAGSTLE